jgi:excisionase family DNA binding protein
VDDPVFLTTAQVMALLQIGRTKLWELVREGAFPAYRLGAGKSAPIRYRRDEVLGWVEHGRMARSATGSRPEQSADAGRE